MVSAASITELHGCKFHDTNDLSIGIEDEFQILDNETLELTNAYDFLISKAPRELKKYLKGELIASEIEINTKTCKTFDEVSIDFKNKRKQLIDLAKKHNLAVCATGVHPFSRWQDQDIINTPHYQWVERELQYVAWRNNTFSFHIHIGVKQPDRAVKLCDALRSFLPILLALSASSPFYEGKVTNLHSTRSQLFTKNFPRSGIPDIYDNWKNYADYIDFLYSTNSIQSITHIWWSIRPHPSYGTLEVRIFDAQPDIEDCLSISAFTLVLAAKLLKEIDKSNTLEYPPRRYIEENFWRAIRHGLSGNLIDIQNKKEVPTKDIIKDLLKWTKPQQSELGVKEQIGHLENILDSGNSAIKQLKMLENGSEIQDIHREMTLTTMKI